jgi:ubiquinone/menaquinone biosynthesis C-methylase UbiE
MAPADTKSAEKAYLARSGSAAWEAAKPFSQAGADTLGDSAQLLHDFSVAMLSLCPSPSDLILDLGAGGCWCSDLLARLNRRSVAVDIAVEMLRVGRSRQINGRTIQAAAGDFEALPFRTGVFDKAICLNAIHHVPDIPKALREIARVLRPDGVAFFSEPGRGHSEERWSTAAMRDYGVLEQDILIDRFAQACREAGFETVSLKALAYTIPAIELSPEEWQRCSRLAGRKRPVRALHKIGRAVLELFGLGKRGPLAEETLERSILRTVVHSMGQHPIVVASKSAQRRAAAVEWAARLDADLPVRGEQSRLLPAVVTVTNIGGRSWPAQSATPIGYVTLGVQLLDEQERMVNRDYWRVPLPRDLQPGESVTLRFEWRAPDVAGKHIVKIDPVVEGVTWFEAAGSTPAVHRIEIS